MSGNALRQNAPPILCWRVICSTAMASDSLHLHRSPSIRRLFSDFLADMRNLNSRVLASSATAPRFPDPDQYCVASISGYSQRTPHMH